MDGGSPPNLPTRRANTKHPKTQNWHAAIEETPVEEGQSTLYSSHPIPVSALQRIFHGKKKPHISLLRILYTTQNKNRQHKIQVPWTITNSWSVYTNRSYVTSHMIQKGILMLKNNIIIIHLTLLKNRILWRIPTRGRDFNPFQHILIVSN